MTVFDRMTEPPARRVTAGLATIGLALRNEQRTLASSRPLSPIQAEILTLLRRRPDQSMRVSAVAREIAMTIAAASSAIAGLVLKGLIAKQPAPEDGRGVLLVLTPAGRGEAVRAARWPALMEGVVERLPQRDQLVLLKAMIRMVETLQQAGQIPAARTCPSCQFFRPHRNSETALPHHCTLHDAAFADHHLRLDCADHRLGDDELRRRNWDSYAGAD